MKKIMIVDDDPDQQFTIKKIMENWQYGYEFITANNGRECLGLLERNETPDLIIMDIMMPEMSGWKTYQKIKENELWRNIPILFLTSRTDRVAKNAGSFLGDGFIEKPRKGLLITFYSSLNKSAVIFTLVSMILLGVYLFSYDNFQIFIKLNILILVLAAIISAILAIVTWQKRWYDAMGFFFKKQKKQ